METFKETLDLGPISVQVQRKAFYRGVKLTVDPSGDVILKAGKAAGKGSLLAFLQSREDWLKASLLEAKNLRERFPIKTFTQGEVYLFCGKEYRLKILPAQEMFVLFSGDELLFHGPQDMEPQKALELLKSTYRETGKKILLEKVGEISQKMALFPKSVHFRGQKSIWGSCSGDNKISLNWKLVVAPLWVMEYVVIHELAHIRYKNHSPTFWALVAEYTDKAKAARKWLKDQVYAADFLAQRSELWKTPPASS